MTDYLSNPHLVVAEEYIKDKKWYDDAFFESLGKFKYPLKYNDQTKVQMNKIIAQQAQIRVGIEKEYPEASKSQIKSLLVTAHWFTGLASMSHAQMEDWQAGNPRIVNEYKAQIDSIKFNFTKERRTWFGMGPTSGTDPNYSSEWGALFALNGTAGSTIGDPADMNGKAGGTAGTLLDNTGVVLWSNDGTGQTVDFVQALLGASFTAFEAFEDSNNGRRMVDPDDLPENGEGSIYTLYVDYPVIRKLKMTHPYDGEKLDLNANVYDLIVAAGVAIKPFKGLGYSFAEDGEINYILVADVKTNFQAGECNKMKWTPLLPTKMGLKPDSEQGMAVRLVPFKMPYFDATNFFKAEVYGKFTYKNDV